MKAALALTFPCIFLAAGIAGPVSAETLRLEFCKDDYYKYEVYELRVDISNSAEIQNGFEVDLIFKDGQVTGPVPVEPVQDGQGRRWWEGRSPRGFYLKEVDVRPRIPGFVVNGPESCRYQVVEDTSRKLCAVRYGFSARQVKVALRADPPEATVRLRRGGSSPASSRGCASAQARKRSPADEKIAAAVQAALAADRFLDSFLIEVEVGNGIVELSGVVNTPEARKKAWEIAARTPGVRSVRRSDALKADLPYDGTGMFELGRKKVTIEKVQGKEVLFFATVDLPADFLTKESFPVSRKDLEDAIRRSFADSEGRQHDRNKELLQKSLAGLGDIQSITIERMTEW